MAAFAGIDKTTPAAGTALGLGDDQIRALKLFLQEVFGIPDATTITEEAMNIAADGGIVINDTGADIDFRVEGANNANMIVVDAGVDGISIGAAAIAGTILSVTPGDIARDMVTSVGLGFHVPADTIAINAAGNSETIAISALAFLGIPTYTSVGTSNVHTNAATLYIQGVPAASTNVTFTNTPNAIWVDAGKCRFDGGLNTVQSVDAVSGPPSDAQLDSAFGTPATLGRGFMGTVDDNDADTTVFLCITSDAAWYTFEGTKAT